MIEFSLFLSGALLMALELTASRILSPYIGSSIFIWTAIIGVIMASLSLGYFWGGKLSNKKVDGQTLANLFFVTGIAIFFIYISKDFILKFFLSIRGLDMRILAVVITTILFAPASFLFGTITPYATRLKIEKLERSGEVVGRLYAISTLGSIVGTFTTGYFLLGYFGSSMILIALGAAMVATSFALCGKSFFSFKKIFLLALCGAFLISLKQNRPSNIVYEADSNYQKIFVFDTKEEGTGRPVRLLRMSVLAHSGRYLDSQDELLFDYIKQLTLIEYFAPRLKNILFIGGGGYTLPSYMVRRNPDLLADVVELDPLVTKVAMEYFDVPATDRIKTFNTDGRSYINKTQKKYDAIILDAYRDEFAMPFELVTREAVGRYFGILEEEGILAINIISSLAGKNSQFLSAEIKTLKEFFPQVLIYQANPEREPFEMQNVVVFAFKKEKKVGKLSRRAEIEKILANRWVGELKSDPPILTDDYAPVERYMVGGY